MKHKHYLIALIASAALLLTDSITWAGCGACESGTPPKAEATEKEAASASTTAVNVPAPVQENKTAEINTAGLKALLDSKVSLILLDARTGKWDDHNRISGAKSLAPDASEEDVKSLLGDKKALIVTYCSNTKCPASGLLAAHLRKLGYGNVIEYPEGIEGWKKTGHQVETPNK